MCTVSSVRVVCGVEHIESSAGPALSAALSMAIPTKNLTWEIGKTVGRAHAIRPCPVVTKALSHGAGVAPVPIGVNAVLDGVTIFMQDHVGIFVVIDAAMTKRYFIAAW